MKIIGNTVGTPLPKPDLRQTNPKKGDYVYGSSEIVKTINGIAPDANGNVEVSGQGGKDGKDGYTPQKGVDYWTDADKVEIKAYVDDAILRGAW